MVTVTDSAGLSDDEVDREDGPAAHLTAGMVAPVEQTGGGEPTDGIRVLVDDREGGPQRGGEREVPEGDEGHVGSTEGLQSRDESDRAVDVCAEDGRGCSRAVEQVADL